jgi:hypothetical protein
MGISNERRLRILEAELAEVRSRMARLKHHIESSMTVVERMQAAAASAERLALVRASLPN